MIKYLKRRRIEFQLDRIGPDCSFTHKRLFFKSSMINLCKKKFKSFDNSSEFRPYAYAHFPSRISIGKRVVIRPGTVLSADKGAEIIIEDDVLMGMGIHIYVDNHKYVDPETPIIDQGYFDSKGVIIEKGSWIGANVIILPGVIIGANSVVGAGSVVTKSVPSGTVYAGNPAKFIKEIDIKSH